MTELCNFYLNTNYYLTGQYGLLFGSDFCKELAEIFKDLYETNNSITKLRKFELTLDIYKYGNVERMQV